MADITFDYIPTNGIHLHTALAGPEDGPPVVLLHGFPEYWIGWEPQIHRLAEAGFRVIAPDQRGYNLSDKPTEVRAYYVTHLVDDITGLADTLGIERFHLAGHDWGAVVAWWAALLRPERLHKLAIVNVPHPAVMIETLKRDPQQRRMSWYVFAFQIPRLPERLALRDGGREFFERAFMQTSKRGTFTRDDFERYGAAWNQPGAMTSMINWYRAYARIGGLNPPGLPANPRVRVPTLMLWGVYDAFLTHAMAEPSTAWADDGTLHFYDASHWVLHEMPDETSDALIAHFRG